LRWAIEVVGPSLYWHCNLRTLVPGSVMIIAPVPAYVVKRLDLTGAVANQDERKPGLVNRHRITRIGDVAREPTPVQVRRKYFPRCSRRKNSSLCRRAPGNHLAAAMVAGRRQSPPCP